MELPYGFIEVHRIAMGSHGSASNCHWVDRSASSHLDIPKTTEHFPDVVHREHAIRDADKGTVEPLVSGNAIT